MANFHKALLLIIVSCLVGAVSANADAPRWVRKGAAGLNAQRSNDTYVFVDINTHDLDLEWLKVSGPDALKKYVEENYAPQYGTVKVTPTASLPYKEFLVTWKGQNGSDYTIEAMLVDEYEVFEDFELNVFQWEYYQLYAVSRPNVRPIYDNFSLTTNYNSQAVVKSIIPGMGQLDKGQTTKGYVILGGEAFFVGATVIFDLKRRNAAKQMKKGQYVGSWNSKRQSWQNFEIGALSCAGALYIYNLIDAAVSKGARQVEVKKATSPRYSLLPYTSFDGVGMSLMVTF